MDLDKFFESELAQHRDTLEAVHRNMRESFVRLVDVCAASLKAGHKILFFGNGGSAADAQHLATELTVRYKQDRAPMAALALTTDTSTLTAAANDFGFQDLFARQVHALGRPGDVAIGISTSGRSENVNRALNTARNLGLTAAALGGRDGGPMRDIADPILIVPSDDTARIQEMHILIGHMLCGALEKELRLL
jgi:D-sedoheptulose 7-phosphate isomerase